MVFFNHNNRELTAKVVYFGPEASGKTTNLVALHQSLDKRAVGKLLSLATAQDRTVYFDLLPVELGDVKGYTIRFQVLTVPGKPSHRETQKLVMKGADGLVFVADSRPTRLRANLDSYSDLQQIQEELSLLGTPLVVQYNKRDLPDALSIPDLAAALGLEARPFVEAAAPQNRGVVETFRLISKLAFVDVIRRSTSAAAGLSAFVRDHPPPEAAKPFTTDGEANVDSERASPSAGFSVPEEPQPGSRDLEDVREVFPAEPLERSVVSQPPSLSG
ncbi:MAG: ADP-ribosylation factor-like protein, partial [Thermoanaerobaculia bacterium]|nr:ADP-ribosylation factor-like protein [Thermoanaerobaculia bacterium]